MSYFSQKSKRLRYRKLDEKDIQKWEEFFIDNDRLKFLGIDLNKSSEALASNWIHKQLDRYQNEGLGHLAIEQADTNQLIGMGGIIPRVINGNNELEIAYSVLPKHWGKGYATEIANTMKIFGFKNTQADRLISIIDVENSSSSNVAKKTGMNMLFKTEYLGMNVDVFGIEKAAYNNGHK